MSSLSDASKNVEERIEEHKNIRDKEMDILRLDLEEYLGIKANSLLAKKIAWFLTRV